MATETRPLSNLEMVAQLQALTLAIRLFGLDGDILPKVLTSSPNHPTQAKA